MLEFQTWYERQLNTDEAEARTIMAWKAEPWAASSCNEKYEMHPGGPQLAVGDGYPWVKPVPDGVWLCDDPGDDCFTLREQWMRQAEYIARYAAPATVLAELTLRRMILNAHEQVVGGRTDPRENLPTYGCQVDVCSVCSSEWPQNTLRGGGQAHADVYTDEYGLPTIWPCLTLRLEAARYHGRPDYNPVWAP